MIFQPYHRPTALRTWRIRLSTSPGSVFQSWVVPYSILAIMSGAAGSAFGSLRRSGTAGNGKGGIASALVCRSGFLRGGGPQVPSLRSAAYSVAFVSVVSGDAGRHSQPP